MATYENLDYGSPDGSIWGLTASDKIGYYGKVPVAQRAFSSALHRTTGFITSASIGTTQTLCVQEIINTLIGLGIYATV